MIRPRLRSGQLRVRRLDGDEVRGPAGPELQDRIVGRRGQPRRPEAARSRRSGSVPGPSSAKVSAEIVCEQQRRVVARLDELDGLPRDLLAELEPGRVDELPGVERQEPGVGRRVGGVRHVDRRFDRRQLLGVERSDPPEPAIGGQRRADEHVRRASTAARGRRPRAACRVARGSPARCWASPSRTMRSARSGSGRLQGGRVVERGLVPGRGFARREVRDRVVARRGRPPLGGREISGERPVPGELDDGRLGEHVGALLQHARGAFVQPSPASTAAARSRARARRARA